MSKKQETYIIRGGIIVFWWLFWLLNVIDKFVTSPGLFWVGTDYLDEFVELFSKIGLENSPIPLALLTVVTVLELLALAYLSVALWNFLKKNEKQTRHYLFLGIFASLIIFTFFMIGDQFFGERSELLEHTIYWITFVITWFVYTHEK